MARAELPTRAERSPPGPTVPLGPATAMMSAAPEALESRLEGIGLTAFALGAVGVLSCVLFAVHVGLTLLDPGSSIPTGSGYVVSAGARATIERLATRVAITDGVRLVVMAAASGALILIGRKLRAGDAAALRPLRAWTLVAFACVALWVALDLAIKLPATLERGDLVGAAMRAARSDPATIAATGQASVAIAVVVVACVPLVLAALPVALRIWSGRLLRAR